MSSKAVFLVHFSLIRVLRTVLSQNRPIAGIKFSLFFLGAFVVFSLRLSVPAHEASSALRASALTSTSRTQVSSVSSAGGQARLADLCAEDKAKIGELVKKLANEKQEKEDFQKRLEEEKRAFEEKLSRMR